MPPEQQEFWSMLTAGTGLAVAAGLPAVLILLLRRPASLFPRASHWPITWNGWVVLVAFVFGLLGGSIMQSLLASTGFFHALYGPDFPLAITDPANETQRQAAHLRGLWGQTLALPVQCLIIICFMRFGTGAQLVQIGLSHRQFNRNYLAGYLAWLIFTPLSFGAFVIALMLFTDQPQKHPLTDLGTAAGNREMVIFALNAALLAPFLEELVFRGILQPWLLQTGAESKDAVVPVEFRPHVCVGIALVLCLQTPAVTDVIQRQRWGELLPALAPSLFVLVTTPLFLVLPRSGWFRKTLRLATPQAAAACLANGILFGAVHANVWPSPIPLFVLGFGLAWLTTRARSIIPAIIVHCLFNAIAVVYTVRLASQG